MIMGTNKLRDQDINGSLMFKRFLIKYDVKIVNRIELSERDSVHLQGLWCRR
jgi:hypothetical protein